MYKLFYNEELLKKAFTSLQLNEEANKLIQQAILKHSKTFTDYMQSIYSMHDSRFVNLFTDEAYHSLGGNKIQQLMGEFKRQIKVPADILVADPYDLLYNLSADPNELFGRYNGYIYDELFYALQEVSNPSIASDLVEDAVKLTSYVSDQIEQMILSQLLSKEMSGEEHCSAGFSNVVLLCPEVINRNLILLTKLSD